MPIALVETPPRRHASAPDLAGAFKEFMRRFLRLLDRLIEAGGPLS